VNYLALVVGCLSATSVTFSSIHQLHAEDSQHSIVFPEIFPVSSSCSTQRQAQDLVFLCTGLLHNNINTVISIRWVSAITMQNKMPSEYLLSRL
jgi:hypothetical protein